MELFRYSWLYFLALVCAIMLSPYVEIYLLAAFYLLCFVGITTLTIVSADPVPEVSVKCVSVQDRTPRRYARRTACQVPIHPLCIMTWVGLTYVFTVPNLTIVFAIKHTLIRTVVTLVSLSLAIILSVALIFTSIADNTDRNAPKSIYHRRIQKWNKFVRGAVINVKSGFCNLCQVTVSHERTRHCWACNKCVYQRHHHCPFLNTCIGRLNALSYFVLVNVGVLYYFCHIILVTCVTVGILTHSTLVTNKVEVPIFRTYIHEYTFYGVLLVTFGILLAMLISSFFIINTNCRDIWFIINSKQLVDETPVHELESLITVKSKTSSVCTLGKHKKVHPSFVIQQEPPIIPMIATAQLPVTPYNPAVPAVTPAV